MISMWTVYRPLMVDESTKEFKDDMGRTPRYRVSTRDKINAAARSARLEAKARRAAREATRGELSSVLGARLSQLVVEEGGPRRLSRKAGIPHSTIVGWRRGIMPTASALLQLSRSTDVSLDWLFGYAVPRQRSEREAIGALRSALHDELVQSIVTTLNADVDFVKAVVPEANVILTDLRAQLTEVARGVLLRKLRWEADARMNRFERAFRSRYVREAWASALQEPEDKAMSALPPSGFQGSLDELRDLQRLALNNAT
jgi:transcriptional regulator with XRE-family HTH domain